MTRNDDDWVRLADVPADLADFLAQVGAEPLRIDMGHATYEVTRDGEAFAVECYGSGGGWYASREMDTHALTRYVRANEPVSLRRPDSQRPGSEGEG